MLFLYLLAALSGSSGWMLFWALAGMFASSRPQYLFYLPLFAAAIHEPKLGALMVILSWLYLMTQSVNAAADRHQERQKALALAAQANVVSENALHAAGKPGA